MITHWSSHTGNAKMEPDLKRNTMRTKHGLPPTHKHMATTWPGGVGWEGGIRVRSDVEESGRINKQHSWIERRWHLVSCAHNDKLSRVWAERGETTVRAKLSQQWPSLLSGQPWLETKWTGTGRYTGSVTQPIMASLTQLKAPGKHDRPGLRNSKTESRTYCFILSFWGPNLGPVGPRLENTYQRSCDFIFVLFSLRCFWTLVVST